MNTVIEEIRTQLWEMRDPAYKAFHAKLIPTIEPERIIGVRTPQLRKYAKEMAKRPEIRDFLGVLPHHYYEENNLHAFILETIKDYDELIQALNIFLPYVDNWATCDMMSPKILKKHTPQLLEEIRKWIQAEGVYTVRFGIGMLMRFYLDEEFDPAYPRWVAAIDRDEYYIRMMQAWYFATALSKQYEKTLPYIEGKKLQAWTHNKAIQKAIESDRISAEHKEYLRTQRL